MSGGLDNYSVQVAIAAYVDANVPFTVVTGSVPTVESLAFKDGHLIPYVVLRFGDQLPRSNGYSFMGPGNDEYYSLFDALCIAETDTTARQLANKVFREIIGQKFANASAISKSFGGGTFAMLDSSKNPVAFVSTASFQYATNIEGVGDYTP